MLRAFYISGIVLAVILFIVSAYYIEETEHAKWRSYDRSYNSYNGYDNYDYYNYSSYSDDDEYTVEAGLITAFFFLFYIALEILTFIKLKTTTMKVLTIIGISLSGIMILWDLAMIIEPGGISFDEVGGMWMFYAIIQIAFCIVGTVHAFRKKV